MVQVEVNVELIKKIARNAKIELKEEELEKLVPQIREIILKSFNKLSEFDTTGIKPSFQPIETSNRFRKDEVKKGITREEALLNVIDNLKEEGYFKGPKAI
ncbi:MAG: Asp-tRNA(Asn)/Glu-tRNA(Gln) amidotransferase subunit GatC [Candidatus Iainarchaeum sp.]|jgi:aspartyl/glutamyl-tRNA(Asn/Gln) amidotransferase C subunit|nr:MAG: aspartyl/glutamyl-tRNA amidotransferase subunit C [archaeon ADurb.Bin336]